MILDSKQIFSYLSSIEEPDELRRHLQQFSQMLGKEAFSKKIAGEVVRRIRLQSVIPDIYHRYRTMVVDGIEYFLSKIAHQRLLDMVVDLAMSGPEAESEKLLLETAKHFPTLHKLGQIIARNPNIHPDVRKWLIRLENGNYGTSVESLLRNHGQNLDLMSNVTTAKAIFFDKQIVSEASVAAVIAYRHGRDKSSAIQGVCKIIKPDIPSFLEEELTILGETASFFQENRDRYHLQSLDIHELFEELRVIMQKEINLAAEQIHLKEAEKLYRNNDLIHIPRVYTFSTPTVTYMEHLEGEKITDAVVPRCVSQKIAETLFDALICSPLYSPEKSVLFHGDPHAGNIIINLKPHSEKFEIGLLDWSLSGRLTLKERLRLNQLIQAVIKRNSYDICTIIESIATSNCRDRKQLQDFITTFFQPQELHGKSLIHTVFLLLEELSYQGLVFGADLLLFRKAIFTLEGVLLDICPDFDCDAQTIRFISTQISQELPLRLGNLFFPFTDRPENYPSLISNRELHSLLIHQYSDFIVKNMESLMQPFVWRGYDHYGIFRS